MTQPNNSLSRRDFLAAATAATLATTAATSVAEANPRKASPPALRAGAAAVKITPALGVSLEGYFMKLGPVIGVHDDLFARSLVLDDGTERLAIVACDMTIIPGQVFDKAKQLIEQRTGLPTSRVLAASTHTHSACRIGLGQGELDKQYVEQLIAGIADSVCQAVENLAPATLGHGSGSKPEYSFNRRWFVRPESIPTDPFGRKVDRVRFNPPKGSKDLIEPAGPVDPEVAVVSVRHADGRPLAVLANYSLHYVGGFKRGEISADYFGVFSRRIAQLLETDQPTPSDDAIPPFVGIMSNGASGDIGGGVSFRKPGPGYAQYKRMEEVGHTMADEAHRVIQSMEHSDGLSLAMAEKEIQLAVRRPDDERLTWANRILDGALKPSHGWSKYYAREATLLTDWPATVPVKLQALRIGSLLIGAIPNEVFCETGLAIKQAGFTKQAFVMELANQYYGYLPTPEQHALGGYETWPARSSCLAVDAEPQIRAGVLELMAAVCPR